MTHRVGLEQDYYWTLGVVPRAGEREIREAFTRKAMAAHPNSGGSVEQLVPIMMAWLILSDPPTRALYDGVRAAPADPVLSGEWASVSARASATAQTSARDYAGAGQDFFGQLNLAANQVQANPAGRAAAAGIAGFVIGGGVGAVAGYYMGVGPLGGAIAGMVAGAVCGAVSNLRGGKMPVPIATKFILV